MTCKMIAEGMCACHGPEAAVLDAVGRDGQEIEIDGVRVGGLAFKRYQFECDDGTMSPDYHFLMLHDGEHGMYVPLDVAWMRDLGTAMIGMANELDPQGVN